MNAPKNVWLIAGTSIFQPPPCLCRRGGRPCDPTWCQCAGRLDPWNCPRDCCAWWATPAVAAAAQAAYRIKTGWA